MCVCVWERFDWFIDLFQINNWGKRGGYKDTENLGRRLWRVLLTVPHGFIEASTINQYHICCWEARRNLHIYMSHRQTDISRNAAGVNDSALRWENAGILINSPDKCSFIGSLFNSRLKFIRLLCKPAFSFFHRRCLEGLAGSNLILILMGFI